MHVINMSTHSGYRATRLSITHTVCVTMSITFLLTLCALATARKLPTAALQADEGPGLVLDDRGTTTATTSAPVTFPSSIIRIVTDKQGPTDGATAPTAPPPSVPSGLPESPLAAIVRTFQQLSGGMGGGGQGLAELVRQVNNVMSDSPREEC